MASKPTTKKTASKKQEVQKRQPQRRRNPQAQVKAEPETSSRSLIDDTTKRDIIGVAFVILAIAVMLVVMLPPNEALVSHFASEWLHLVLGVGCYILPFIFAGIGLTFLYRNRPAGLSSRVAIGLSIVFVAVLGFIALFTPISVLGTDNTSLLFSPTMLVNFGGYVGAGLAWAGITCFGRVITGVILIGLIVVGVLIIGFSISKTIDLVRRKKHELARRADGEGGFGKDLLNFKRKSESDSIRAAGFKAGNSFDYDLDELPSKPTNITRPLMARGRYPSSDEGCKRSAYRNYGDDSRLPGPFVSPYKLHDEATQAQGDIAVNTVPLRYGRTPDEVWEDFGPDTSSDADTVFIDPNRKVVDVFDDALDGDDASVAAQAHTMASEQDDADLDDGRTDAPSVPFVPRIPSGFIPIEDLVIEHRDDDDEFVRLPVIGNAALSIPRPERISPQERSNRRTMSKGRDLNDLPMIDLDEYARSSSVADGSVDLPKTDEGKNAAIDIDGADVPSDDADDLLDGTFDEGTSRGGTVIPQKPYVVLDDILSDGATLDTGDINIVLEDADSGEDGSSKGRRSSSDTVGAASGKANGSTKKASSSSRRSASATSSRSVTLADGFDYTLPSFDLLKSSKDTGSSNANDVELEETADRLARTLSDFGIKAQVVGWIAGPTVTLFKVDLPSGVRVSRITALNDDLALALAAPGVRIFAPIPGTNHVGIEVPNANRQNVFLADVLKDAPDGPLQIAIGKDVEGNSIISDLSKMPHLLIGGTTGSGKSVSINAMIMSILMRATPDEVRFIMIDPKRVEFTPYNGIPHLYVPVVTEPKEAASALSWGVAEMERRLKVFSKHGARNILQYNEKVDMGIIDQEDDDTAAEKLPYIVIIIDELADLMMNVGKEVEFSISRIAQLARAAGIHLIVATQRPSTNVVTGLIKANITNRIAFNVASGIDSRVILDTPGAENLIGLGDLLLSKPELSKPQRIQGCYVSEDEINAVVDVVRSQSTPEYHTDILQTNLMSLGDTSPSGGSGGDDDPLLWEAASIVISSKIGSTSNIQRRLKVGYARAGRIMDQLEEKGIVGSANGTKPREVLVDEMELETIKAFEMQD